MGGKASDDEGSEVFEPLGGAVRLHSSAARNACRFQPYQTRISMRGNIWGFCGGLLVASH